MKKLDWSAVTAANGLVFEEQTFEHMNNGHKDSYIAFVKANIPSAWHTGKLVILYGCVATGTNPNPRTLSAGAVYYNGEIYQVDAASFTTTGLQVGVWTLTDVDSGTSESTIKTSTSSFLSHVLVNSKFVFAAGLSGSGTFNEDSSNVLRYDTDNEHIYIKTTTSNGVAMSVNVTGSAPFAFTSFVPYYSYIIKNKICVLNFNITFDVSDGADIDLIRIPLPLGVVKSTSDGENYSNYGVFFLKAIPSTSDYGSGIVQSIGDGSEGQTLELRRSESGNIFSISTGASVSLKGNISFKVV